MFDQTHLQLQFCKKILDDFKEAVFFVDNQMRILYWNKLAEQISGWTATEVLGRCCWNNILRHTDEQGNPLCANACPLSKAIADATKQETVSVLSHKDGRQIYVLMQDSPIKDDNGMVIGAVQFFRELSSQEVTTRSESKKELNKMDFVDSLTRLPNHKFGELRIASLVKELNRGGLDCSIMLVNIDNYQDLLKEYGQDFCNNLIKTSVKILATAMNPSDSLSRWSEECFLLTTENTKKSLVMFAANKIQSALSKPFVLNEIPVNLQISVSATMPKATDNTDMVLNRLDRQLKRSIESGQHLILVDG